MRNEGFRMNKQEFFKRAKECFEDASIYFEDDIYEMLMEFDNFDDLLENGLTTSNSDISESLDDQAEFIYYMDALTYLDYNDNSLCSSLLIAEELGYALKDINSTLLATVLKREKIVEDFYSVVDDLRTEEVK